MSDLRGVKDENGKWLYFNETDALQVWWLTPVRSNPLLRLFLLPGLKFVFHRYERFFESFLDDDGNNVRVPSAGFLQRDEWKLVSADFAIDLLIQYGQQPHKDIQYLFDERRIGTSDSCEKPNWDSETRELRFRGMLLKRFKQPAQNQTAILDEFQVEDWRIRIAIPLKNANRQQVADAVRNLNENALIRFELDGTAEGIVWRVKSPEQN